MQILVAPVGRLVAGNVLDVSLKPFVRALNDYDKELYVTWNPDKQRGNGCWEIRRKPLTKQVVESVTFQGNTYSRVEYVENPRIHHVLDCAFLNYDALNKLKRMDCWANKNWVSDMEYNERTYQVNKEEKDRKELAYGLKQYRSAAADFRERVLSGVNPALLARYWK